MTRHFGTRARLQRVLRRHGDVSVVRVRLRLCPLRGPGHGRDRSDRGGCPGDHHVRRDCRPFFVSPAAGATIRQSSAPARARARSLDPGTRSRDGGIAARSRSPEYASVSRRACRLEPPTPRLAEASVDHFLGLLVVCGGVGGHDRVCSHVFLWKASLFRFPLLPLTSPPSDPAAVT